MQLIEPYRIPSFELLKKNSLYFSIILLLFSISYFRAIYDLETKRISLIVYSVVCYINNDHITSRLIVCHGPRNTIQQRNNCKEEVAIAIM